MESRLSQSKMASTASLILILHVRYTIWLSTSNASLVKIHKKYEITKIVLKPLSFPQSTQKKYCEVASLQISGNIVSVISI